MNSLLFDEATSTVQRLEPCRRGRFGHVFGGPSRHAGTAVPGFPPAHLLYLLDLADPRIGLQIPDVTRLPLYYALRNVEGGFSYRVVSDSEIEILSNPYRKRQSAALRKTFPAPFRQHPVDLEEHPHDPQNLEDALFMAGIFGFDRLSEQDEAEAVRRLTEAFEQDFVNDPPASVEEMLFYAGSTPFIQGPPRSPCPNPDCELHGYDSSREPRRYRGPLRLLLAIYPEKDDVPLYDEVGGADGGELIFEVCPLCNSARVSNPCT